MSGRPARAVFDAFLRPVRSRLLLAAVLGSLTLVCGIGLLATAAWLISRAAQMPLLLTLSVAIVAVRAFGIGRGVFRYAERLVAHDAVLQVLGEVRARVFEALVEAEPTRQMSMRRTDALVTLVRDVDELQYLPLRVYLPLVSSAVAALACVCVEWSIDPFAAVAVLALSTACALIAWAGARVGGAQEGAATPPEHQVAAVVGDVMAGAADIAVLGSGAAALDRVRDAEAELRRRSRSVVVVTTVGNGCSLALTGVTMWALAAHLVPRMAAGSISPVLLAPALLLPLAMYEIFTTFTQAAAAWRQVRGPLASVAQVMSVPKASSALVNGTRSVAAPEAQTAENTLESKGSAHEGQCAVRADASSQAESAQQGRPDAREAVRERIASAPAAGRDERAGEWARVGLRVDHLSAAWPGAQSETVHDITFEIQCGEVAAIEGESGSGKSTVIAAIAGLLPHTGTVRAGRIDMSDASDATLRQVLAVAEQEPHIFSTSIAENVRVGAAVREQVDDESVWCALVATGLAGWVRTLPDGLATHVGAGGVMLSGGQRQRLALARLLVGRASVWLLDEPSEYLNDEAAQSLRESVAAAAAARGITRLVVSHRDADLIGADYRFVMRRGRLVSRGQ